MHSSFAALVNRLKSTYRWSGMHAHQPEDVAQHSYTTAVIAHLLCLIDDAVFGKAVDAHQVVIGALYHDVTESILTDVIAPVKKYNKQMESMFQQLECLAEEQIVLSLPTELQPSMRNSLAGDAQTKLYIKAADKLDALCRATLEVHRGNQEFSVAMQQLHEQVYELAEQMQCVQYFVDVFLPAFRQSVDEYWYLK